MEHSNSTSSCSGCSYVSSSNNYDNDMKSSRPRRPNWVVADLWLFSPSARKFLPERPPGSAILWFDSHPAQQSFSQHPSWPNSFPWLPLVAQPPCATDHCLGWHSHDPVALRPQVLWHGSHQCPQLSGQGGPMVSTGSLNPQGLLSFLWRSPFEHPPSP